MAKVINLRTDRSEHDRPEQSMVAPSEPETWQREPQENDLTPAQIALFKASETPSAPSPAIASRVP